MAAEIAILYVGYHYWLVWQDDVVASQRVGLLLSAGEVRVSFLGDMTKDTKKES